MFKVTLLLAATIFAHFHAVWLLQRNLETGSMLHITWAIIELIWGLRLLQQAFKLFKRTYIQIK